MLFYLLAGLVIVFGAVCLGLVVAMLILWAYEKLAAFLLATDARNEAMQRHPSNGVLYWNSETEAFQKKPVYNHRRKVFDRDREIS